MTTEPSNGAISGRAAFHAAILALVCAEVAGEVWWCDADFADWPLDDPALIDALARWLERPGRQLTLLACGYDELVRRHPRFVAWRRYRAHQVLGREVAIEPAQMPTLLLAAAPHGLELVDRQRFRGLHIADATGWRDARERIDVLLQQSQPSFGATTLGL